MKKVENSRNGATDAIASHHAESTVAIDYYKDCVDPAPQLYESLYSQFYDIIELGKSSSEENIARMAESASEQLFDISSDLYKD